MLKHSTDEQRSQAECTRRRIGRIFRLEAPYALSPDGFSEARGQSPYSVQDHPGYRRRMSSMESASYCNLHGFVHPRRVRIVERPSSIVGCTSVCFAS